MKNSKGITLIALIITIIVMIILVAVTVNVALNGGLFGKAETAATKTTKEIEKEKLISAMVGGVQAGGKFDITKVDLPDGANWITSKDNTTEKDSPNKSGNWVLTSTGDIFYVSKDGNVLDEEPTDLDEKPTDLAKLIEVFMGKDFNSVYVDNDPGGLSANGIELVYVNSVQGEGENVGVFEYNEKNYKIGYDESTGLINIIEEYNQ